MSDAVGTDTQPVEVEVSSKESEIKDSVHTFGGKAAGEGLARKVVSAFRDIGSVSKATNTNQPETDPDGLMLGIGGSIHGDAREPPMPINLLLAQMTRNTRLRRSVMTYARNVAGLGYLLVPKDPKSLHDDPTAKAILEEIEMLSDKLEFIGNKPFEDILFQQGVDQEATGQGYLEVIRDANYDVKELKNVPPQNVKIRKKGGFVYESRAGVKVFYKDFGDERDIDKKTGLPTGSTKGSGENLANELWMIQIYAPESPYYGLPRWISATQAVLGNWLCAERNVSFFDNDTVPRMAILVSGGSLSKGSLTHIQEFFRNNQGVENAHRVIVIQTDKQSSLQVGQELRGSIELKPLTVGLNEDGEFLKYRKDNDDEILEAFGIHKAFFTSEDVNKANAEIGRRITNEQEFEPSRKSREYQLNKFIMPALGAKLVRIKLKGPESLDETERSIVDAKMSVQGALSPNDIRMRAGVPEYPPEYIFAKYPREVSKLLFEAGLIELVEGFGKREPKALVAGNAANSANPAPTKSKVTELEKKDEPEDISVNKGTKPAEAEATVGNAFKKGLESSDTKLYKLSGKTCEAGGAGHGYFVDKSDEYNGETTEVNGHGHEVTPESFARGETEESFGHKHKLEEMA